MSDEKVFIDTCKEMRALIQGNAISDLNHYEANERRISELEKSNKTPWEWVLELKKEIAELKEQLQEIDERHKTWWVDLADIVRKGVPNIKEVLREFIDAVGVDCYRYEFDGETNKEVAEEQIKFQDHLLAKLEVGSARQTVKCTDCVYANGQNKCWATKGFFDPTDTRCCFTPKETEKKEGLCQKCEYFKEANNISYWCSKHKGANINKETCSWYNPKASGGEKSDGVEETPSKSSTDLANQTNMARHPNSKPPEPKCYCNIGQGYICWICEAKKKEERVRDATRQEPREDLPKHGFLNKKYVMVKREDLEYLIMEAGNEWGIDYGRINRIKEEYKID